MPRKEPKLQPTETVMDFGDLSTPIEVEIKNLNGKDYRLREASGDVVCKFQNKRAKCMKFGTDGKTASVENIADIDPELVSMCMFGEGKPGEFTINVPVATVRSWSARILKQLVDKVKKISDMEELEESVAELEKKLEAAREKAKDKEQELKNELEATISGSE